VIHGTVAIDTAPFASASVWSLDTHFYDYIENLRSRIDIVSTCLGELLSSRAALLDEDLLFEEIVWTWQPNLST
jgi:hypothetical protein